MSDASQGPFFTPTLIPTIRLPGGRKLHALGIGTSFGSKKHNPSSAKSAIRHAIGLGHTHFQTEVSSHLEQHVGEAIAEALENIGPVGSREGVSITSKIRFNDAASDSIVSNLKKSLETLNLESVDIFLIEWPGSDVIKHGKKEEGNTENGEFSVNDFMSAWKAMEQCQSLGLAKFIGVCNFSTKMLESLLKFAETIPSVNQVGMQQMWKEKGLREFCSANNITMIVSAAVDGEDKDFDYNQFMATEGFKIEEGSDVMKLAQVYFKWAYDQGAALLLESLDENLIREMLHIFK